MERAVQYQHQSTSRPTAWYLVYTQARQERVAFDNLRRQNFHVYLPLFKTLRKPPKGTQKAEMLVAFEPMFPRYVFFGPSNSRQSIATVRSTRGVQSIVMCGSELAIVQSDVLQAIRAMEEERNRAGLQVITPFQPGSRVRMLDPALNRLEGLVQCVSSKRIILLLEILGRTMTVKVGHDRVELV